MLRLIRKPDVCIGRRSFRALRVCLARCERRHKDCVAIRGTGPMREFEVALVIDRTRAGCCLDKEECVVFFGIGDDVGQYGKVCARKTETFEGRVAEQHFGIGYLLG